MRNKTPEKPGQTIHIYFDILIIQERHWEACTKFISQLIAGQAKSTDMEVIRTPWGIFYSFRINHTYRAIFEHLEKDKKHYLDCLGVTKHDYSIIERKRHRGSRAGRAERLEQIAEAASKKENREKLAKKPAFVGKGNMAAYHSICQVEEPMLLNTGQEKMLTLPWPAQIEGIPGSGKTSMAWLILQHCLAKASDDARFLYLAPFDDLVSSFSSLCEDSRLLCVTPRKLLELHFPQSKVIADKDPENLCFWLKNQIDTYKKLGKHNSGKTLGDAFFQKTAEIEAEIKLVVALSESQYLNMGTSQCAFHEPEQRAWIFQICQAYQAFLKKNNLLHPAFYIDWKTVVGTKPYERVVIDEYLNFTLHQLLQFFGLANNENIIYLGDEQQVMSFNTNILNNFQQGLYQLKKSGQIKREPVKLRLPDICYRASPTFARHCLAPLLKVNNFLCGEKVHEAVLESPVYPPGFEAPPRNEADFQWLTSPEELLLLKEKIGDYPLGVIAFNQAGMTFANQFFDSLNIYPVKNCPGMEWPIVVLIDIFNCAPVAELSSHIQASKLTGPVEDQWLRESRKLPALSPAAKLFINKLWVAVSRGMLQVYFYQPKVQHKKQAYLHYLKENGFTTDARELLIPAALTQRTSVEDWQIIANRLVATRRPENLDKAWKIYQEKLKKTDWDFHLDYPQSAMEMPVLKSMEALMQPSPKSGLSFIDYCLANPGRIDSHLRPLFESKPEWTGCLHLKNELSLLPKLLESENGCRFLDYLIRKNEALIAPIFSLLHDTPAEERWIAFFFESLLAGSSLEKKIDLLKKPMSGGPSYSAFLASRAPTRMIALLDKHEEVLFSMGWSFKVDDQQFSTLQFLMNEKIQLLEKYIAHTRIDPIEIIPELRQKLNDFPSEGDFSLKEIPQIMQSLQKYNDTKVLRSLEKTGETLTSAIHQSLANAELPLVSSARLLKALFLKRIELFFTNDTEALSVWSQELNQFIYKNNLPDFSAYRRAQKKIAYGDTIIDSKEKDALHKWHFFQDLNFWQMPARFACLHGSRDTAIRLRMTTTPLLEKAGGLASLYYDKGIYTEAELRAQVLQLETALLRTGFAETTALIFANQEQAINCYFKDSGNWAYLNLDTGKISLSEKLSTTDLCLLIWKKFSTGQQAVFSTLVITTAEKKALISDFGMKPVYQLEEKTKTAEMPLLLALAVVENDVNLLASLLHKQVPAYIPVGWKNMTPTEYAAQHGHVEAMLLLIKSQGKILLATGSTATSPFSRAAESNQIAIVEALSAADLRYTQTEMDLSKTMAWAVQINAIPMLKLLLKKCSYLPETLNVAMYLATRQNLAEILNLLLQSGGNPNISTTESDDGQFQLQNFADDHSVCWKRWNLIKKSNAKSTELPVEISIYQQAWIVNSTRSMLFFNRHKIGLNDPVAPRMDGNEARALRQQALIKDYPNKHYGLAFHRMLEALQIFKFQDQPDLEAIIKGYSTLASCVRERAREYLLSGKVHEAMFYLKVAKFYCELSLKKLDKANETAGIKPEIFTKEQTEQTKKMKGIEELLTPLESCTPNGR